MSDTRSNGGISSLIDKYKEKYGVWFSVLIICVIVFGAISSFTNFIQTLPFGLSKNLIIVFAIVIALALFLWRGLRKYKYIKYRYSINKGKLFLGDLRDVALRVQSLLTILDAIAQNKSMPDYESSLKETGSSVGHSFAEEFGRILENDRRLWKKDLSFSEKVKRWLEYDSRAGMGKFTGQLDDVIYEGRITLQNSFATYERQRSRNKSLCSFVAGYIEGVLQELCACQDIRVSHSSQKGECGLLKRDPEKCVFIVKNITVHPE